MEEKAEAEYLMRELIKQMKTQKAVAERLGQTKQAFNYSLHHAQSVPLKRILAMRVLLDELLAKESANLIPTPLIESTRLKLELSHLNKKDILAHFKAAQAFLLSRYRHGTTSHFSLKMINTTIYCDPDLLEAEKNTRLPLRTAFIGLLACCDKDGQFYWDTEWLKATIFPYTPINFSQLLEALFACGLIHKKQVAGRLFGYVPLKNIFVYEDQLKH